MTRLSNPNLDSLAGASAQIKADTTRSLIRWSHNQNSFVFSFYDEAKTAVSHLPITLNGDGSITVNDEKGNINNYGSLNDFLNVFKHTGHNIDPQKLDVSDAAATNAPYLEMQIGLAATQAQQAAQSPPNNSNGMLVKNAAGVVHQLARNEAGHYEAQPIPNYMPSAADAAVNVQFWQGEDAHSYIAFEAQGKQCILDMDKDRFWADGKPVTPQDTAAYYANYVNNNPQSSFSGYMQERIFSEQIKQAIHSRTRIDNLSDTRSLRANASTLPPELCNYSASAETHGIWLQGDNQFKAGPPEARYTVDFNGNKMQDRSQVGMDIFQTEGPRDHPDAFIEYVIHHGITDIVAVGATEEKGSRKFQDYISNGYGSPDQPPCVIKNENGSYTFYNGTDAVTSTVLHLPEIADHTTVEGVTEQHLEDVNRLMGPPGAASNNKALFHCSAGVGRSASVALAVTLCKMAEANNGQLTTEMAFQKWAEFNQKRQSLQHAYQVHGAINFANRLYEKRHGMAMNLDTQATLQHAQVMQNNAAVQPVTPAPPEPDLNRQQSNHADPDIRGDVDVSSPLLNDSIRKINENYGSYNRVDKDGNFEQALGNTLTEIETKQGLDAAIEFMHEIAYLQTQPNFIRDDDSFCIHKFLIEGEGQKYFDQALYDQVAQKHSAPSSGATNDTQQQDSLEARLQALSNERDETTVESKETSALAQSSSSRSWSSWASNAALSTIKQLFKGVVALAALANGQLPGMPVRNQQACIEAPNIAKSTTELDAPTSAEADPIIIEAFERVEAMSFNSIDETGYARFQEGNEWFCTDGDNVKHFNNNTSEWQPVNEQDPLFSALQRRGADEVLLNTLESTTEPEVVQNQRERLADNRRTATLSEATTPSNSASNSGTDQQADAGYDYEGSRMGMR